MALPTIIINQSVYGLERLASPPNLNVHTI